MKKKLHYLIEGRVQGVFFRATARNKAQELDLHGWIKNRSDGKVEGEVEGEEENLKKFASFLEVGSSAARVEDVHLDWKEYQDEFSSFEIKYY